jgi:serine/threonine protein kinase
MDTRAASNASASLLIADAGVPITTDIDLTADLDESAMISQATLEPSRTMQRLRPAPQLQELDSLAHPTKKVLPLAPGRVLLDRFVLTQIIGTGGTCIVFRARDLEAHGAAPRFLAIKTPRPDHADPKRAIDRLQREYHNAKRLNHSGIVQTFDLKQDGDIWFMTMEMLEGESLATLARRNGSVVAPALTRRLLKSAAEALAFSHSAGVVHGDFNMANVFVVPGDRVKLLDFGTACSGDQAGVRAATPAYASPQVLEGATPSVHDDVFSFACVAYELLAAHHPFNGQSSKDARAAGVRPQAPEQLTSEQALALMAGLAWESEARPSDVKTFAQSIMPQAQLRRTVIEDDDLFDIPLPSERDDKRWWLFGAACIAAMIVAVLMTRLS